MWRTGACLRALGAWWRSSLPRTAPTDPGPSPLNGRRVPGVRHRTVSGLFVVRGLEPSRPALDFLRHVLDLGHRGALGEGIQQPRCFFGMSNVAANCSNFSFSASFYLCRRASARRSFIDSDDGSAGAGWPLAGPLGRPSARALPQCCTVVLERPICRKSGLRPAVQALVTFKQHGPLLGRREMRLV